MLRESRMQPSLFWAINCRADASDRMDSFVQISCRKVTVSRVVMRLKSNIWQRDKMVGRILCFSVVAKMKIAWGGGSSSVFRKALKAEELSMCTSSMIYTL